MPYTSKEAMVCRGDFPALARELNGIPLSYLDGPGGTQVPQRVIDAIGDYYGRCNANTHGAFITSSETDQVMDKALVAENQASTLLQLLELVQVHMQARLQADRVRVRARFTGLHC